MKTLFFTFILLYYAAVSAYSGFHPNGGEVLRAGEQVELRWQGDVFAGESVRIVVHDGGRGEGIVVAEGYPGHLGRFGWRIPEGLRGDLFRLVVIGERSGERRQGVGYFRIALGGTAAPSPGRSSSRLHIAPNPAVEHITCTWHEEGSIEVVLSSVSGEEIERRRVSGDRQYYRSVRDLANGAYYVLVRLLGGEHLFGKFIVRRE